MLEASLAETHAQELARLQEDHERATAEVERLQVLGRRLHQRLGRFQGEPLPLAAVLVPLLAAGILHQDAANGLGRGREEMTAMVPMVAVGCAYQPEVGLVNESSRLQGVARRFVGQPGGGETAKVFVDQRQQLPGGVGVALLDGRQDASRFAHRWRQVGK